MRELLPLLYDPAELRGIRFASLDYFGTNEMASWQRTHTCGELRETHIGETVTLNGWVNTYRAYNDQIFIDLRDRYGLTQIVLEADPSALFQAAQEIRNEWVLSVRGKVRERLPDKHNPKLATGDIELLVQELNLLNRCPTPPFEVLSVPLEGQTLGDTESANEDLRLQYRFLDLRRPTLQRTLALRHRLNKIIRDNLDTQGFLEVETPILGRSLSRRRPRLSRAEPGDAGELVCVAAIAAALQANPDGGGL